MGYRAEGIAWRLGQGSTPEQVAEEPDELCGPDALAAFYRRSAVESVGGFSSSAVGTLAAIDMALSLQHAGFRCIVEPKCLAQVDAAAVRDKPGFRHGRDAERLFWHWASAHGRVRSLAAHAALVAGECVIGLWRPSMLVHLAGRAVGAIGAALGKRPPSQRKPPTSTSRRSSPRRVLPQPLAAKSNVHSRRVRVLARDRVSHVQNSVDAATGSLRHVSRTLVSC